MDPVIPDVRLLNTSKEPEINGDIWSLLIAPTYGVIRNRKTQQLVSKKMIDGSLVGEMVFD